MGNEITAFGNILFAITSLIGVFYFSYWLRTQARTDNTRTVVRAWIAKDLAILARIGWWIIALIFAPDELKGFSPDGFPLVYVYHPWFVEYKHWLTVPTSLLYVGAQYVFIQHIVGFSQWRKWGLMLITVGIAAGVTFAGF